MNLIYFLSITKVLHTKKYGLKMFGKNIRKEARFLVNLITEIVQLINIIFNFIFSSIKSIIKKICQSKTVNNSIDDNSYKIIDLSEYKIKNAK